MANIAAEIERALAERATSGGPGKTTPRLLAQGPGWTVADVVCTSGPCDRAFEEQHSSMSIAIVAAGSFEYRSASGRELMTPGSLLLGHPGQQFECGHEHAAGDRCLAFQYHPEYFETLLSDAAPQDVRSFFRVLRVPPIRDLSRLTARACANLASPSTASCIEWEEIGILLAVQAMQLISDAVMVSKSLPSASVARVTQIVRMIERTPTAALDLKTLAREARLSPYHFLRTFERLTGLTPHQYILRARLREAAVRLVSEPAKVLDIALDSGFGDVSNFNRAFRGEYGLSPRAYRNQCAFSKRICDGVRYSHFSD